MATSNRTLIRALRDTATRLSDGAKYEWGHMGRCNCGHLVQTITNMSAYEIVESIDFALDEWTEHAQDYCQGTGQKLEDLFCALQDVGFYREDVIHLENLSDEQVLKRIDSEKRYLQRNSRNDVILYMNTMAELLAEELVV